jgi:hypothetical protein
MQNTPQLVLTPVQLALREALNARDSTLGNMYYGALLALTAEGNPERFSQCAQSLRELIQRLTYVQDDVNLGTKVKELGEKWRKCKKTSGGVREQILNTMAADLDIFFSWVDEKRSSRGKLARKILDELDPMFAMLPADIIDSQAKVWLELRKHFENVAHHNHLPQEAAFKERVDAFSSFLLNLLQPRTSDNFAEIQKLIREGETDAQ